MIAEKLIHHFETAGYISNDEVDVVRYGIYYLIMNFAAFSIMLLMGFIFSREVEAVTLIITLFPLRKYAGGFHAKDHRVCISISFGIILCSFIVMHLNCIEDSVLLALSIVSFFIIICFSPVDCENKKLDNEERRIYKKRVVQVIAIEVLLIIISYILNFEHIIRGIMISWNLVSIAIVGGLIKQ